MASTGEILLQALLQRFPPWVLTVFVILTIVALCIHIYLIYTFEGVVSTLAAIESTSPAADSESTFVVDDEAAEHLLTQRDTTTSETETDPKSSGQEQLQMATQTRRPITSSIRGTIKHLEREAGSRLARVRGFHVYLLWSTSANVIGLGIAQMSGNNPYLFVLGLVLGLTASAWLIMVHTHMMISRPRNEWFWKRARFTKQTWQILLPTFIWAFANMFSLVLGMLLTFKLFPIPGLTTTPSENAQTPPDLSILGIVAKVVLLLFVNVLLGLSLSIPARILLDRCQAALLSSEETPIVPFDRTFGGRVAKGAGLSLRDAWQSCDWRTYTRVARIYLITLALGCACWVVHGILVVSLAELTVRR